MDFATNIRQHNRKLLNKSLQEKLLLRMLCLASGNHKVLHGCGYRLLHNTGLFSFSERPQGVVVGHSFLPRNLQHSDPLGSTVCHAVKNPLWSFSWMLHPWGLSQLLQSCRVLQGQGKDMVHLRLREPASDTYIVLHLYVIEICFYLYDIYKLLLYYSTPAF